ncbi:uncharacterized protein M6B38_366735 [Iris pallida]|uniref:CCHC-type domain-containing protein n=1 Tax=Iris pallida TaxID=29817 RepID=A0AAX6GGS8_IRIPA|nr:uncharacterized protein M6B38_366735 [Iris pallida]
MAAAKWAQKSVVIPPHNRGCHLVTPIILREIEQDLLSFRCGVAHFFLQHTGASLTINENYDSDVQDDTETFLNKIVPEVQSAPWKHAMEEMTNMSNLGTSSSSKVEPSIGPMERILRIMEVQQKQVEAQQKGVETQLETQQKQLTALQQIVQTIMVNNHSTMAAANKPVKVEAEEPQPAKEKSSVFNISEFKEVCNTLFQGTEDPALAMDWLIELEDHFELLGIHELKRVACAQLLLRLNAHDWWVVEKRFILGNDKDKKITWAMFKKAFEEYYLPPTVRRQKENEFVHLKQGNMTVQQYAKEFNKLAKFASSQLPDATTRARRFEGGLRPAIRAHVMVQEYQTMRESLNHALTLEPQYPPTVSGAVHNFSHKRPSTTGDNNAQKRHNNGDNQGQNQGLYCAKCKRRGHQTSNCRVLDVGCFKCGCMSHLARNCQGGRLNQHPLQYQHQQNHDQALRPPQTALQDVHNRQQTTQGRVFALTREEAFASNTIMSGPVDMPEHTMSSMFGCALAIPITDGRLNMGTWQDIWLCEHRDHATPRKIVITLNGV